MKILFLSFYFEPDLCAGSFRNSPLASMLKKKVSKDSEIIVITTQPNRYKSYSLKADSYEERGKLKIHRIDIPTHNSGMKDQIKSFYSFYKNALRISKGYEFDLVYASSSRLFTAYLGRKISRKINVPYYIDVRDIFVDSMKNILRNRIIKLSVISILKYIELKTFKQAKHINLISEGFYPYFKKKYPEASYSFFSNGVDDVFIESKKEERKQDKVFNIVYAGNIGQGQGLEKIIPDAAKALGSKYKFEIYGDGGTKQKLKDRIHELNLSNVHLKNPINREGLLKVYNEADFLFVHLNDFKAFEKVLPSKVFEYGAYSVPIIAGVGGFAKKFISENIENTIVFTPCDYNELISMLKTYEYKRVTRASFVEKYRRSRINSEMASSIINLLE